MARSHHRKKHKEHLRQFKHKNDTASSKVKSKASSVFTLIGMIIGIAISFFASNGNLIWIAAGALAGSITGYFIGRRIDGRKNE
jgi:uncharacterized membrane protein YfcA